MDLVNTSNDDATNMGERLTEGNAAQVDDYKNKVDDLFTKVDGVSLYAAAEYVIPNGNINVISI